MSEYRVASRYAKPVFELSEEMKVVEDVKKDMDLINSLNQESRDFELMLKSPIIAPLKKASILEAVFKGKIHELSMKMIQLLSKKNRADLLSDVANAFVDLYNAKHGLTKVSVTTSYELGEDQKALFAELAEKLTGKKATMTTEIDTSIIGGFKLFLGDKQIDKTISSQLRDMKLKLTK